jgi:hypothetical protein
MEEQGLGPRYYAGTGQDYCFRACSGVQDFGVSNRHLKKLGILEDLDVQLRSEETSLLHPSTSAMFHPYQKNACSVPCSVFLNTLHHLLRLSVSCTKDRPAKACVDLCYLSSL